MLKRISSGFLELRRALSWGSRVDASGPNQNTQNEDGQNASAPAAPAAPIVADSEERKEFDKTLDIVYPSAELPLELPELPYALPGGYSVDAEGHLRAYANTGFVVDETPEFHSTLRQNPGVAAAIKSLHIVLQGPQEIDLTKRDSTAATQRKGLSEWSKTIPALKNLTKVKISHFSSSAAVDGEDVIYVPGEDEAEKNATAEEKGHSDVSAVIKSLAWYAEDLNLVELEGVDFSEEAAKAFEGSKVSSLKLEACPTRVSSVIPRLSKLGEIIVTEKGDFSVGCDYVGLLNHVKGTLTAVALNLRDSKIDLQEFTTSLSGAPLTIIRCSFASSTPELPAEEIEQKLKDAFPTFGRPAGEEKLTGEDEQPQQPPQSQQHQAEPSSESTATTVFSTPVKKASESDDMELDSTTGGISGSEAEMGMLSERNSGTSTPTRKALKRSALVERRKEELKAAELASSKDKLSKITGTGSVPRKLRSTPSRHK